MTKRVAKYISLGSNYFLFFVAVMDLLKVDRSLHMYTV